MGKNIAIIGRSAAGLYLALLLAQQRARVKLFEASGRMDTEPRTLIVTSRFNELLSRVGATVPFHQIRRFELFTDGRFTTISLQQPDLVIDRAALIEALAEKARQAGVAIHGTSAFLGLEGNGKQLRFRISKRGDNLSQTADFLVGADGAFSTVAQSAGWQPLVTAPLIQTVVGLPPDQSPDTARVWFLPKDTKYFFWLIPHSATTGVLGLIGREGTDETSALATLTRFADHKRLTPSTEPQQALIPVYRKWISPCKQLNAGHVYLVGDAAAHVKVSTVGGIVTGFKGAVGVAEAILNDGQSAKLRHLRQELDQHKLIRKVLNGFRQEHYSRLIDLLTLSAKHTLSHINRDESRKLIWTLIIKQPRLLTLGLRSLLHKRLFLLR